MAIKRLKLTNVQSHKNTELEFSPYLNVIVGSSNQGKSAILRSIRWVKDNRPTSSTKTLNSYWNRDEKGNPIDEYSVEIENDYGIVRRYRDSKVNGYEVNGNKLEAIKTDVPQIVSDTLRITDTNFQNQHDSAFLLTMSAPDATKYINQLCHLDSIDDILAKAEKNRRDVQSEIKTCERDIDMSDKYLKENEWILEADTLCSRLERFETELEKLNDESDDYTVDYVNYLGRGSFIETAKELIEIYELELQLHNLKEEVAEVNKPTFDYELAESYVERINKFESEIKELIEMRDDLNNVHVAKLNIECNDDMISKLESTLPDVCPLCGKPIGD